MNGTNYVLAGIYGLPWAIYAYLRCVYAPMVRELFRKGRGGNGMG